MKLHERFLEESKQLEECQNQLVEQNNLRASEQETGIHHQIYTTILTFIFVRPSVRPSFIMILETSIRNSITLLIKLPMAN